MWLAAEKIETELNPLASKFGELGAQECLVSLLWGVVGKQDQHIPIGGLEN